MLNDRYNSNDLENAQLLLKPLWLVCYQYDITFIEPDFIFQNKYLKSPDILVSFSAYENGWYRKYSSYQNVVVYNHSEIEKVLLKADVYDLLIVAPLSFNSLAKFSLGLQDSAPTYIFSKFVQLGKPVLLETSHISTSLKNVNPYFIKIYKKYLQDLIGGTITEFKISNFSMFVDKIVKQRRNIITQKKILESTRNVITKEDVINAYNAMMPIIVNSKAIITPLALEEAERLGVEVKYEF